MKLILPRNKGNMDTFDISSLTSTSHNNKILGFELLSSSTTSLKTFLYRSSLSRCDNRISIPIEDCFINLYDRKIESDSFHTMLASERVLSKDWSSPEEDEAWSDL
jgi:hypothetical protein